MSASNDSNISMKATQRHRKVKGRHIHRWTDRHKDGQTEKRMDNMWIAFKGQIDENLKGHNKYLLEVIRYGFVRFKGQ